jgi:uncharacterized protein (TIGR00251 family)
MFSLGEIKVIPILETSGGISIAIKLQPRARKNAITGQVGDALKVSLTAPPVDGKANQACIEFFANLLKVPRSSVTIASGQSSRNKVIRIAGVSTEEIRQRIRI